VFVGDGDCAQEAQQAASAAGAVVVAVFSVHIASSRAGSMDEQVGHRDQM
jgi:hypothetical protein